MYKIEFSSKKRVEEVLKTTTKMSWKSSVKKF